MSNVINWFLSIFIGPKRPGVAGRVIAKWDCVDNDGESYFHPFCHVTLIIPPMPKHGKKMYLQEAYGRPDDSSQYHNAPPATPIEPGKEITFAIPSQAIYWRVLVTNNHGETPGENQNWGYG